METIGDAYMVVGGAPERQENHPQLICDMALDMVEAITDLKDPSTGTLALDLVEAITDLKDPSTRALSH